MIESFCVERGNVSVKLFDVDSWRGRLEFTSLSNRTIRRRNLSWRLSKDFVRHWKKTRRSKIKMCVVKIMDVPWVTYLKLETPWPWTYSARNNSILKIQHFWLLQASLQFTSEEKLSSWFHLKNHGFIHKMKLQKAVESREIVQLSMEIWRKKNNWL